MRAMAVRILRLASRTNFLKISVTTTNEGQDREGSQGQLHVQRNSSAAITTNRKKSLIMVTTPAANKSFKGVDVRGHARHQAPHGIAVKVGHRQALKMPENFLAHVVHGLLADALHDANLHVLCEKIEDQHAQIEKR